MTDPRTYLALGDSMSIDRYTGVEGGGAAAQFFRRLGAGWDVIDLTSDGCVIEAVPRDRHGDLLTVTIGGNDLYAFQEKWLSEGLAAFESSHRRLLEELRAANPASLIVIGNVYAPQFPLGERREALLDEANTMISADAQAIGARLADLRSAFRGREEELLTRLIEPNLAGATIIADLFEAAALGDG